MLPHPDGEPFDYTDGASQVEISSALAQEPYSQTRARRDSQVGSSYSGDDDNEHASAAIFDGYGAGAIPSSVTSMHHDRVISWSRDRRASLSSRNKLYSSGRSRANRVDGSISSSTGRLLDSQDSENPLDNRGDVSDSDGDDAGSYYGRQSMQSYTSGSAKGSRSRRERTAASPSRSSTMLQSFAGMFSRVSINAPENRPDSVSRRSSAASSRSILKTSRRRSSSRHSYSSSGSDRVSDEGTERWGYSSGEEQEEEGNRYASDIRIHMGKFESFREFEADPLPLGPPSRQTIYIEDEDMTVLFIGREIIQWKAWLWNIGCFATLGILGLVGFWNNSIWIRWATRDKSFESLGVDGSVGIIVIEVWFCVNKWLQY